MNGSRAVSIQHRSRLPETGGCHPLVYWGLVALSIGTFTPCVLLPEWRAFQEVRAAERAEQVRLDALRAVVEREQRALRAMQSDPAVVARMAQRELNYQPRNARPVPVLVPPVSAARNEPGNAGATRSNQSHQSLAGGAEALHRMAAYLPAFNYDAVFCEEPTRTIVACLSVGLLLVACFLPAHRRIPPTVRRLAR